MFYADHPKVKPVADKHAKLVVELGDARRALAGLEDERAAAVQADRQAFADAKRASKPAPSEDHVLKADEKIAAARREVEALEIAVSDQAAAVEDAVEKHRLAWLADVANRIDVGRERLSAAIEELIIARAALSHLHQVENWLQGKGAGEPRFLASIESLRTPAGEPVPWAAVEQALRAMAAEPTRHQDRGIDQRTWAATPTGDLGRESEAQDAQTSPEHVAAEADALLREAEQTGGSVLDVASTPMRSRRVTS